MSWTTHRARILCAALVTTALVVVGAWSATDRTAAAWTNDVHAATDVALGSWGSIIASCTPLDANLNEVPGECPNFVVEGSVSGETDVVGRRRSGISISAAGAPPSSSTYYRVVLDLSLWEDGPDNWDFDGGWFGGGELVPWPSGVARVPCSDLPEATLILHGWIANPGAVVFFWLAESGWTGAEPTPYCER